MKTKTETAAPLYRALTPAEIKQLPEHYDICPRCDRPHHIYHGSPSAPFRRAMCGQPFQWTDSPRGPRDPRRTAAR